MLAPPEDEKSPSGPDPELEKPAEADDDSSDNTAYFSFQDLSEALDEVSFLDAPEEDTINKISLLGFGSRAQDSYTGKCKYSLSLLQCESAAWI